jgi:hypothetical protein
MAVHTRSSSTPNGRAWGAFLVGLLAVAAVPAGVALTHYRHIELLKAGWAVVPGLVLGIASVALARAARRRTERTIGRVGGGGVTRLGRYLGALGIYVALAAALSVGVYELLNRLSG